MIKKILFIIAISILIVGFTGCIGITNAKVSFNYKKFKAERAKWIEAEVKDYTYEYYSSGFSFESVKVIIEDGKYKESIPDERSHVKEYRNTIKEIYDEIERTYLSNNDKLVSDSDVYMTAINVEYDEINHIPIDVGYSYHKPEWVSVDGNFGFEIKEFTKISK